MKLKSVTISKRGYILLPADIRKEMGIKPGTRVMINKEHGRIILETVQSFTQKLSGLTRHSMGNTPDEVDSFIDEERKERNND